MPAGYGWSFPAADELRIGVGSFDPRFHVKETTVLLAEDLDAAAGPLPGQLDPAQAARRRPRAAIFFVGDSAGHCLPLTAEGIRTALYFGDRARRELRAVVEGRRTATQALRATPSSTTRTSGSSAGCCAPSGCVPRLPPALLRALIRALGSKRFIDWSFGHYLRIAPPEFALPAPPAAPRPAERGLAAAA